MEITTQQINSLSCFHHFHTGCIEKWLRKKTNCPCCRTNCNTWNSDKKEFEKVNMETDFLSKPISTRQGTILTPIRLSDYLFRQHTLVEVSTYRIYYRRDEEEIPVQTSNQTREPFPIPRISIHSIPDSDNVNVTNEETGELLGPFYRRDFDLVQSQAGCSFEEAVWATIQNEGDIVNAIMQLTM